MGSFRSKRDYKNILIIKLCCIGDVLFTTPLVRALKNTYPRSRITYMVGNWSKEVIENNPNIDDILVFDPPFKKIDILKNMIGIIHIIIEGRRKKFDIAFVCHRSPISNILVLLMGIKERVGFDYRGSGIALTTPVFFDIKKHEVLRYLDLAKAVGSQEDRRDMEIRVTPDEEVKAESLLEGLGIDKIDRIVCISPGGGINPGTFMPSKRWMRERFAEVADIIIKRYNTKIIFIGGSTDIDLIHYIIKMMKNNKMAYNIANKTNWRQTAAVIKRCDLFIGNDSGALYVATAVGTPTISIFGPSSPELVAPLGINHSYIYKAVDCSPCYNPESVIEKKSFECENVKCLREITIEDVLETVERHIKSLHIYQT